MANLNMHPAPGLSNVLPGWHVVPQNPMARKAYGVSRTPGIGEILRANYVVPQNPVTRGVSGCGSSCTCGGSCGCATGFVNGMGGFGEDWTTATAKFTTGDIMGGIQSPIFGVPLWGWGAGLIALMMFAGGSSRRRR